MTTQERLQAYYEFTPETIDQVAEAAELQQSYDSYEEFFDDIGITTPERKTYPGHKPVEFLDIRPNEHDANEALVIHLPFAQTFNNNQLYQVATIAATNPNKRIIVMGNSAALGYDTGLLTREQRRTVNSGDFSPVVEPLLSYLDEEDITIASHVGYSYGEALAQTTMTKDERDTYRAVIIEPAAVVWRSLYKLVRDFHASAEAEPGYVNATDVTSFLDARKSSEGMPAYIGGLLRLSNLAVGRGLTKPYFRERQREALLQHPELRITDVWGSESELALDGIVTAAVRDLQWEFGKERVKPMRLLRQKHALANDIHLQAAVVLEGLR
jgi:hypothetical protein